MKTKKRAKNAGKSKNAKAAPKPPSGLTPKAPRRKSTEAQSKAIERMGKADSIAQAAAATGHSVELLKLAKRMGCAAFQDSRVDLFILEEWLALNPEQAAEENRLLTIKQAEMIDRIARALSRREAYRKQRRELITMEEVKRSFMRSGLAAKAKFLAIAPTMCQKLAMLTDPVEVEQELRSRMREAMAELAKSPYGGEELVK